MLVGGPTAQRGKRAWIQVYRSLNHYKAKEACDKIIANGSKHSFPDSIIHFSRSFVSLQKARHSADYDPSYRVNRAEALDLIKTAEKALADLNKTPLKHKRAFAIFVLFPPPRP